MYVPPIIARGATVLECFFLRVHNKFGVVIVER